MRRIFLFLGIFLLFIFNHGVLAQKIEVDSAELQKRMDIEFQAFKDFKDSLTRAKGIISDTSTTDNQIQQSISSAIEEQWENQQKVFQYKKIIFWLFISVTIAGVILSKLWKKRNKTGNQ